MIRRILIPRVNLNQFVIFFFTFENIHSIKSIMQIIWHRINSVKSLIFYSQNILQEKSTETSICDNNIRVV